MVDAGQLPDAANRRRPHPKLLSQPTRAPVRGGNGGNGGNGLVVKRLVDDARFKLRGHAGGAPGARRIVHQDFHPNVQEALAPIPIKFEGDVLVRSILSALSGQQNDLGSLLHTSLDAPKPSTLVGRSHAHCPENRTGCCCPTHQGRSVPHQIGSPISSALH